MALNTILYNGKAYEDQDIEEATGYRKSSTIGDELSYDTFDAEVWDYANALLMLADSGPKIAMMNADGRFMLARMSNEKMTDFTYGAPVTWTHRGKVVLKQFLESVKRTGKYKFLLSCVSGIGLIAKSRHYGGLYSNVPFSTALSDVIGSAFPYTVDSDVASAAVYGWLPVDNRRNNLRKLLTAYGVLIKANADGSIRFSSPDITMPTQLADQDLFIGGSVDHPTPYQAVKITEHAFAKTPNDILTALLDGEAVGADIITPKGVSMNGALVTFNDPMHDLAITGSTILESGVNYAVLAPSAYCTLTGYKYSHTTRVVTAGALTATEQATKRLDDCTLVNLFNVDAVAQRWLEYFSAPKTVQVSAVWRGEQPGGAAIMSDPYDEQAVGIIEQQDVRLSAKLVAETTVQTGKIPTISGNLYTKVLVVTQSGPVTIPADSKGKVRLVLISGGTGGGSGYKGGTPQYPPAQTETRTSDGVTSKERLQYPAPPASGGAPGNPGTGGKVYQVTLDVTPGQQFDAVIGAGGTGGVFSVTQENPDGGDVPGGAGTDTTFGSYSSADGAQLPTGFFDQINGVLYAAPGESGIPGGDGGGWIDGKGDIEPKSVYVDGQITGHGGATIVSSSSQTDEQGTIYSDYGYKEAVGWGGYGGGGANGGDGGDGTHGTARTDSNAAIATGGPGGNGGNAAKPVKASARGSGGRGGNGGGAAGSGGAAMAVNRYKTSPAPIFSASSAPGTPGNGSDGGDGADGVLLIYY